MATAMPVIVEIRCVMNERTRQGAGRMNIKPVGNLSIYVAIAPRGLIWSCSFRDRVYGISGEIPKPPYPSYTTHVHIVSIILL